MNEHDKDLPPMPVRSETMQAAANTLHETLPDMGFILIVVPFGDSNAGYISNCNREDAIRGLKSVLFRWGINEEWMKGAK